MRRSFVQWIQARPSMPGLSPKARVPASVIAFMAGATLHGAREAS